MSFFTGKKASKRSKTFQFKQSFLILVAAVSCIFYSFPVSTYAEADYANNENDSIVTVSKKIFHKHTGSSESGGGCYTVQKTETRMEEEKCRGVMTYWPDLGTTTCSKCGASYFGDESGRECYYSIQVPKKYYYYELGCGKNTTSAIGVLTVSKDTEDWARSVFLTGVYENKGGLSVGNNVYIWNGGAATESNVYEALSCGTYSLSLNVKNKGNVTGNKVTIEVRNVDNTAPEMAVAYDKDSLAKSVDITVSAMDLQPDKTEGCGLHEIPYSFDGGNTWTSNPVYTVKKNGPLTISVRDCLENTTVQTENIANIDSTGPMISYKMEPYAWTNRDVVVYLSAEDTGDAGGRAAGLPQDWYSLDDGKTWKRDSGFTVTENGTVTVLARDLLGNCSKENIVISHIDKDAPRVNASVKVKGAERKKALIQITATDTGAGLHDAAYSWDNGETYTEDNTSIVNKNGIYFVLVRDKVGNIAKESVEVQVIGEKTDNEDNDETEEEEESTTPVPPSPDPEETKQDDETESDVEEETTEEDTTEEETVTESETESEEDITEAITEEETTETDSESTEEATEETIVLMEELVDEPSPLKVQELKQNARWTMGEIVALIILILALLLLLLFLLILWYRTIAIYAKDNNGQMQYMGRTWIHNREKHYEVDISQSVMERCETTYLEFRPSALFAKMHGGEEMHFLFPDGVCVTLPIAQKIEME